MLRLRSLSVRTYCPALRNLASFASVAPARRGPADFSRYYRCARIGAPAARVTRLFLDAGRATATVGSLRDVSVRDGVP